MDTLIELTNWLLFLVFLLFGITVILMPYIFFSMRRRFDPLFGNVSGAKGEMFHPMQRAMGYALCLAAPWWAARNKYILKLYQGYDFRANSTKLQITLAWIFSYSTFLSFVFLFTSIGIRYCLGLPTEGMISPSH